MHHEQDQVPLQQVQVKYYTNENVSNSKSRKTNIFLYIIAAIANMLSFSTGISMIWINPILPKLDGTKGMDENPFGRPITSSEISWLAALSPLGASMGPLIAGRLAHKIGRKRILLILACLKILNLLITVFANRIYLFYISRFLAGVAFGGVFSTLPMFLTEIAESHNRGALGCSMAIFVALGVNFALTVGPYLRIETFSLVCMFPSIFFVISFYIVSPESPLFLASVNNVSKLESSLRKLRNKSPEEIHLEAANMLEIVQKTDQGSGNILDLLRIGYLRKGLIISLGLGVLQQAVGFGPIFSYLQIIFESAKANLAAEYCVMIIGSCQLLGTVASSVIVDRVGRRILLLISSLGICVTLTTLGLYFYLKNNEFQVESISWLPVSSLAFFIVSYGIGLGPVPWVVMAELFPPKVRSLAATIISFTTFMITFIVTVMFPSLSLSLGMAKCFFMFSLVSMVGSLFIYRMVPETKGKSLQAIQTLLMHD